jgi:hypothetical protein
MEFVHRFFLYMGLASMLCLLAGLLKPWMMLWWEDTQNRKKVLRIYGTAAAVSFGLYWLSCLI